MCESEEGECFSKGKEWACEEGGEGEESGLPAAMRAELSVGVGEGGEDESSVTPADERERSVDIGGKNEMRWWLMGG